MWIVDNVDTLRKAKQNTLPNEHVLLHLCIVN